MLILNASTKVLLPNGTFDGTVIGAPFIERTTNSKKISNKLQKLLQKVLHLRLLWIIYLIRNLELKTVSKFCNNH